MDIPDSKKNRPTGNQGGNRQGKKDKKERKGKDKSPGGKNNRKHRQGKKVPGQQKGRKYMYPRPLILQKIQAAVAQCVKRTRVLMTCTKAVSSVSKQRRDTV